MTPHDALILDRFMLSSALSVVWGGLGFTQLASSPARAQLQGWMRGPVLVSSAIAATAAIAAVPIQLTLPGWSSLKNHYGYGDDVSCFGQSLFDRTALPKLS
jgi:hypothetical protein